MLDSISAQEIKRRLVTWSLCIHTTHGPLTIADSTNRGLTALGSQIQRHDGCKATGTERTKIQWRDGRKYRTLTNSVTRWTRGDDHWREPMAVRPRVPSTPMRTRSGTQKRYSRTTTHEKWLTKNWPTDKGLWITAYGSRITNIGSRISTGPSAPIVPALTPSTWPFLRLCPRLSFFLDKTYCGNRNTVRIDRRNTNNYRTDIRTHCNVDSHRFH